MQPVPDDDVNSDTSSIWDQLDDADVTDVTTEVGKVDVIIGTDIIYAHNHLEDLALTIRYWLKESGTAYLINNKLRSEMARMEGIVAATPGLEIVATKELPYPTDIIQHCIVNGISGADFSAQQTHSPYTLLQLRRCA